MSVRQLVCFFVRALAIIMRSLALTRAFLQSTFVILLLLEHFRAAKNVIFFLLFLFFALAYDNILYAK